MGEEPSDMKLERGQRLRLIYHPNNHGPGGSTDPTIEEFQSIGRALDEFGQRVRSQRGMVRQAGKFGPPEPTHWPDGNDTAFMEVWIVNSADVKGEAPSVPEDVWQRWTWADDGQVWRQDF